LNALRTGSVTRLTHGHFTKRHSFTVPLRIRGTKTFSNHSVGANAEGEVDVIDPRYIADAISLQREKFFAVDALPGIRSIAWYVVIAHLIGEFIVIPFDPPVDAPLRVIGDEPSQHRSVD
jgi:hypothetical protein